MQYDLFTNPGKEDKKLHARVVHGRHISNEELIDELLHYRNNDKSNVISNLVLLEQTLANLLADGCSVQVGSLGTFQLSLQCPNDVENPEDTRAEHIGVKTINFRPSKTFLESVRKEAIFERAKYKTHSLSIDDVELNDYLNTTEFFNRPDFQKHFHMTTSTATRRLKALCDAKIIRKVNSDKMHPLYSKC